MTAEKKSKPKMQPSRVFDLAGLVEYGPGAVVSRSLVDDDAGTVTIFAFDTDQSLSEHTAPFDALVQIVEGEGYSSHCYRLTYNVLCRIHGNKGIVASVDIINSSHYG